MPVKLEREWSVPAADRKTTDRPDYTSEQSNVNVSVDVQTDRIEAIIIANSTDNVNSTDGYEGSWSPTGEFIKTRGAVFSNESGTIFIEQSTDGSTLVVQTTQAYTGASYAGGFVEDIVLPYVRVRFMPTAGTTTTFIIWARLSME